MKFYEEPEHTKPRPASTKYQPQAVTNTPQDVRLPRLVSDAEMPSQKVPAYREEIKPKSGYNRALVDAAYIQLHSDQPNYSGAQTDSEQINVLEEQVKAIAKRQNYFIEDERASRMRLENALKQEREQTELIVKDLANRVALLDQTYRSGDDQIGGVLENVKLIGLS